MELIVYLVRFFPACVVYPITPSLTPSGLPSFRQSDGVEKVGTDCLVRLFTACVVKKKNWADCLVRFFSACVVYTISSALTPTRLPSFRQCDGVEKLGTDCSVRLFTACVVYPTSPSLTHHSLRRKLRGSSSAERVPSHKEQERQRLLQPNVKRDWGQEQWAVKTKHTHQDLRTRSPSVSAQATGMLGLANALCKPLLEALKRGAHNACPSCLRGTALAQNGFAAC